MNGCFRANHQRTAGYTSDRIVDAISRIQVQGVAVLPDASSALAVNAKLIEKARRTVK